MFSPATHSAAEVVRLLGLEPLPREGGWFRRTNQSAVARADGRVAWSAILALFTPEQFSALHRLASDEVWCFHAGDPLESLRLHPDGRGEWVRLGFDVRGGQRPQDVVAAGVWQGTRVVAGGRWALVSCLVVPGFRWEDFETGSRAALAARYSDWAGDIRALTRV